MNDKMTQNPQEQVEGAIVTALATKDTTDIFSGPLITECPTSHMAHLSRRARATFTSAASPQPHLGPPVWYPSNRPSACISKEN